jgi:hypothetical protein
MVASERRESAFSRIWCDFASGHLAGIVDPMTVMDVLQERSWRFPVGVSVFVVGFGSPLWIPLVARSSMSAESKALLSALLAVGIPELLSLAAVAIMGRAGFERAKRALFRLLARFEPSERVSRVRHRVGLVLFSVPLVVGWIAPYVGYLVPAFEAHRLFMAASLDLLLVSSLFVLGGEFWDKLRALFVHDANAVFHE